MINKRILFLLLIVVVGLASYANSFTVPFSFDDEVNIADNPVIKDLGNFTGSAMGYASNPRRYIGLLTFALNYSLGGLEVFGYHLVNLCIHIINSMLVYGLVMLTFKTPYFSDRQCAAGLNLLTIRSPRPLSDSQLTIDRPHFVALFAGLLFVAHPVQTQAVTYIVQRYTSLATLFYLLALVLYTQGRLSTQGAAGREHGAKGKAQRAENALRRALSPLLLYSLSLVSAVCAMMTKEISFTLPLMISLYEFTFFRAPLRKKLLFLVPVLLTLIIIPVSIMGTDKPLGEVLSDLSDKTRLQTDMSRGDYLVTEIRVIVTYLRLILLPVNQNLDYDYPVYHSLFTPQVFLSFLLLSSLVWTAVYLLYKTRNEQPAPTAGSLSPFAFGLLRLVAFGILWFFLALSVESSVIPIVDVIFEHRVYLPSIGAFIALAAGLYTAAMKLERRWPKAKKAVVPFALMIAVVLSGVTFARNRVWKDNITLWGDVAGKSPHGVRPHVIFGQVLLRSGKADRAIEEFQKALAIEPFSFNAHIYLGLAFDSKGLTDKAIEQYNMATLIYPDSADAHNDLGVAFFRKGLVDKAIEQYRAASALRPADANFHFNLGIAYEQKGLVEEAIEEYKAAVRLRPSEPAFNQGLANASGKRTSLPNKASR